MTLCLNILLNNGSFVQVLQERVQETFWLVGTIETNSKLSFEQMFANSFLWYLHSSDLSFISSADSFLCSDTSLASWNLWIFSCGIFQGNPGERQPLADKKCRGGECWCCPLLMSHIWKDHFSWCFCPKQFCILHKCSLKSENKSTFVGLCSFPCTWSLLLVAQQSGSHSSDTDRHRKWQNDKCVFLCNLQG